MDDGAAGIDIARLVAEHHAAVYRYALWLAGTPAEAEDLCQQAYLIAQRKLGQLRSAASARSWLFTTLRRRFLRGRKRWQPMSAGNLRLNLDSLPASDAATDPLDLDELRQALAGLPEGFRLILVMFYFEELSYRDIATALDVPIGTVMSRLARAKAALRGKLFGAENPAAEGVGREAIANCKSTTGHTGGARIDHRE